VITFAWPDALLALVAVLVIAALTLRGVRRRAAANIRYGGSDDLRVGRSALLRGVRSMLFVAALALLIVGIARPQWGAQETIVEQRGIDVVFAIDVSRSMEAADVAPTRAEAVADSLNEMLTHLHGNRVGLVIFGDTHFLRSPLTLDLDAISTLITRAQREGALVQPGTSLAAGIEGALDVLDVREPAHAQVIVLASDGEDLSGVPVEPAMERARERGVPVYALFSGTDMPTPLSHTGGIEDITTADRSAMELIASESGAQLRDPSNVVGLAVEFRRMRQMAFAAETDAAQRERFHWFVAGALGLLVLQGLIPEATAPRRARPRRGAIAVATGGMVLLLAACSGTAIWQHVDAGNRAYLEGRFDDALASYREAQVLDDDREFAPELAYNAGNALHRLERYNSAIDETRAAIEEAEDGIQTATMRYALGNHHFRLDDLIAARDAYIAVLRHDPGDFDAKANLELVLRALTPEPPPDEGVPGDEPGDGNGEGPGEVNGDEPPPEPPDNGDADNGDSDNGDANGDQDTPGDPINGTPVDPGSPGEEELTEFDEILNQLEQLLGEIGEEITADEALRLLELHRRLNELGRLPSAPTSDRVPPR
jgi:Ca-activated chloride channel homolog